MRCDFHCHTRYSYDSLISPTDVVRTIQKRGLEVVAITDHNTFYGVAEAVAAAEKVKIVVIPCMEVRTEIGDIIGLFLTQEITSRNFKKATEEIRSQNGIVMLPHPWKSSKLTEELIEQVDAVEIFNARCSQEENGYAFELARKYAKPGIFGSDAHLRREIGIGYCEIDATVDFSSIKAGILKGATAVHETCSPKWNTLFSQMVKIFRTGQVLPSMKTLKEHGRALLKNNQSR